MIRFEIDYLRLNFQKDFASALFNECFEGLSDNSNEKHIEFMGYLFKVVYFQTSQKKILNFYHDNLNLFTLEKIMQSNVLHRISYVMNFYGTFFYTSLREDLLRKIITTFQNDIFLSRIDLALDVETSVNDFLNKGYVTQFKIKDTKENGDRIETKYFGNRSDTNKRHFIRIYDKKLDSSKKNKLEVHYFYLNFKEVTRIEAQINALSCKELGFRKDINLIFDRKFLESIFTSICINKSGTYFNALEDTDFNDEIVRRKKFVKTNNVLDIARYARLGYSYNKTLFLQGFDPVAHFYKHILKDLREDFKMRCFTILELKEFQKNKNLR